jgi:hypothetical protein
MLRSFVFCAVLGLLGSASAGALAARDAPEVNEAFGLYAYGDSVSGLSLFYAGGPEDLFLPEFRYDLTRTRQSHDR